MFACFQSVGSLPVVRYVLNITVSGMLMQFLIRFMTLGRRPPGQIVFYLVNDTFVRVV